MDSEHVDMLLRIIKAVKSVYDILNSHCVNTSGLPSDSIIQLLSLSIHFGLQMCNYKIDSQHVHILLGIIKDIKRVHDMLN